MSSWGQQQVALLSEPEASTTNLVPADRTPWTAQQVGQELVYAWTEKFGSGPTARSVAILLSQWALETGRGRSCYCSNLGNVRPPQTRGDTLCCQLPRVSEIIEGKEYFFAPPQSGSTFRAFRDLDDGSSFYLNLLYTRFSHAWSAVIAGDPQAYAIALHEQHYYTADVQVYTRTLMALFNEFLSIAVMGSSANAPTEIPEEIVAQHRIAANEYWLSTLDMDQDESGAGNIPPEIG